MSFEDTQVHLSNYRLHSTYQSPHKEKQSLQCFESALDLSTDHSDDVVSTNSSDNNEANPTILNSALQQKKKVTIDETKYKTEVCKNWSETGQCPYGKRCKFAHGKQDLNEKKPTDRSYYKSKKCNSFNNQNICMYGVRCLFSHDQRTLKQLLDRYYYNKFISCPSFLEEGPFQKQKRLPFFQKKAEKEKFTIDPKLFGFNDSEDMFQYFLTSFKTPSNLML